MTHMYFSARTEGRISYGHLGHTSLFLLHCALASCGAVYCNRSCLWVCSFVCVCVCVFVCGCGCLSVCYQDNSKLRASMFTKLGFIIGKGSDHLQLIKFWPSRAPGKGVCGWAKIFGSALLKPARSVCVSLSAFFIDTIIGYRICLKNEYRACQQGGRNSKLRPANSRLHPYFGF